MMPGLGRLYAPDDRDRRHLTRALVAPVMPVRTYRNYRCGPVLDQGQTSQCVGFAWRGFLNAAPLMTHDGPDAPGIYHGAQDNDEWDGNAYEGTSVRGGAKYLQGQGRLASYLWALSVADIEAWMLTGRGGVVLGTNWYSGSFDPDKDGRIRLTGSIAGGHAYFCYGLHRERAIVRIQNSWGTSWGVSGRGYLAYEDLERLLKEDGEAATAIEQKGPL